MNQKRSAILSLVLALVLLVTSSLTAASAAAAGGTGPDDALRTGNGLAAPGARPGSVVQFPL